VKVSVEALSALVLEKLKFKKMKEERQEQDGRIEKA
jgi:hypothetical protein